jgi:hypothetical protein
MVMNYGVQTALGTLEGLRDKYERNGKAVDAELEGVFLSPPPWTALTRSKGSSRRPAKAWRRERLPVSWLGLS